VTIASFCSGIGAPETAAHELGWRSAFVSEIEAFPCAVLAHRFPAVPNLGDMTRITPDQMREHEPVDLFVAGTPCQSFSVAGLRQGLADPRGNLALEFLRLVDAARPRWVVFENVPGLLSSDGGRCFGAFLGGLGQLGYGWAYRVLDAQFVRVQSHPRAVPQRRRRVFVVGCLGSWQRAAAVLLERQSLCGHPAPRREAGPSVAALAANGVGTCGEDDNQAQAGHLIGGGVGANNFGERDTATALSTKNQRLDGDTETFVVAHSLRDEGFDASEDGTGRGTPLVTAFDWTQSGKPLDDLSPCLRVGSGLGIPSGPAIAFQPRIGRNGRGYSEGIIPTLNGADAGATSDMRPCIAAGMTVRRLTPLECERLQGFPDGHTAIDHKGKPAADGPRYKALGNSIAVNVMSFIFRRIAAVEAEAPA
jgi:DNA (cytosine-5)-methyltransferase 1